MNDELLSLEASAVRLDVSLNTVKRLARQGVLPIVRIGYRTLRVLAAALEEYVAHGVATAQGERAALAAYKSFASRDRASGPRPRVTGHHAGSKVL